MSCSEAIGLMHEDNLLTSMVWFVRPTRREDFDLVLLKDGEVGAEEVGVFGGVVVGACSC